MKDQGEVLRQLSLMLGELSSDISLCEAGMQQAEASWRRLYVRSTLASIEGFAYFLKQHTFNNRMIACYDSFKSGTPNLPLRELCLLAEETYTLKDNGNPKTANTKLSTIPNLVFALTSFAEAVGAGWKITKDEGFAALKTAVGIRDRITHPKSLDALTVTDEEIETVKTASNWLRREFTSIIKCTPGATIEEAEPPNKTAGGDA